MRDPGEEFVTYNAMREYMHEFGAELTRNIIQQTGAMHEETTHRLQAVAEEVSSLSVKLDEVKKVQDSHTEMIGSLQVCVSLYARKTWWKSNRTLLYSRLT